MALKGKIRALHEREGKSISEIASASAAEVPQGEVAGEVGAVCSHIDADFEGAMRTGPSVSGVRLVLCWCNCRRRATMAATAGSLTSFATGAGAKAKLC